MANEYFEIERRLEAAANDYASPEWHDATKLLQFAADTLACEWATLWLVDPVKHALFAHTVWKSNKLNAEDLKSDTTLRSLSPSEGMPGHIWKSKRSAFSQNLEMDMALPRSLKALKAGLQAGLWLPIIENGKVHAIIEFLGRKPAGQTVLPILNRFGTTLGNKLRPLR